MLEAQQEERMAEAQERDVEETERGGEGKDRQPSRTVGQLAEGDAGGGGENPEGECAVHGSLISRVE